MNEVFSFYSKLFGVGDEDNSNNRDEHEILDCLDRDITTSMNESLI